MSVVPAWDPSPGCTPMLPTLTTYVRAFPFLPPDVVRELDRGLASASGPSPSGALACHTRPLTQWPNLRYFLGGGWLARRFCHQHLVAWTKSCLAVFFLRGGGLLDNSFPRRLLTSATYPLAPGGGGGGCLGLARGGRVHNRGVRTAPWSTRLTASPSSSTTAFPTRAPAGMPFPLFPLSRIGVRFPQPWHNPPYLETLGVQGILP